MTSISIHKSITNGGAAIAHQNHHLMQTLRIQAPVIPHHRWTFTIGIRVAFLCMDEVSKFLRVFDEENRCIVSYEIPVAVFRVKLYSKSTRISLGVSTSFLATNG